MAKEIIPENLFKISPSDFSFAWRECRRCFWLKNVKGLIRPDRPMAAIYGSIDRAMRAYYRDRVLTLETAGVEYQLRMDTKERKIRSAPFFVEGYAKGVFISGKTDALAFPAEPAEADELWCEVHDFKTSEPKPENIALYGNQLEGYAYCMEHPADPATPAYRVRALRLGIFTPMAYEDHLEEIATSRALTGQEKFLAIARDADGFEQGFLTDVVRLLNGQIPPPNGICKFCEMDRVTSQIAQQRDELSQRDVELWQRLLTAVGGDESYGRLKITEAVEARLSAGTAA